MIGVLADDFSGAAEIAGVALRHGLSVELFTELPSTASADVLVTDTNSRSLSRDAAIARVRARLHQLQKMQPAWIYKKTDSVLRGHVVPELAVMMQDLQKTRVLLIPANPGNERIVSNGKIYIKGQLLHHTVFRHDPEYPARHAEVLRLLETRHDNVKKVLKITGENLPAEGIVVGETRNRDELERWADTWNESFLPAGGSEFFSALLHRLGHARCENLLPQKLFRDKMVLNLWGTSIQSAEKTGRFQQAGFHFFEIPVPDSCADQAGLSEQIIRMAGLIRDKKRLVLKPSGRNFTCYCASLLRALLDKVHIDEFIIEGGTTASEMLRYLNWNEFRPVLEIAPGIVRLVVMQHPGLNLTVKPGSYAWPEQVWQIL
ncbi:hypothetical protein GF406_00490 [candidate division KSB1 bacterium]|nr:hypothetical protein [candidate division KSB1 bacterium]